FLRVLEQLRAPSMYYSVAGVRDGIIADLSMRGVGRDLSRLTPQQLRVAESMCRKYQVDLKNARHVARLSAELFHHLRPLHKLRAEYGKLLEAAAYLHDSGHFVSDTGHHKHSAYLVQNADLPGYTEQERQIIAMLCRYHRKSLPAPRHEAFRALPLEARQAVLHLTPLLRLAVGLDTSREQKIEHVDVQMNNGSPALNVRSEADVDLELWAAERATDSFRQVYGVPLPVARTKP
ncbi:MAG: HD domain-containing protein, partial [Bryobacteraceae bacterium]